MLGAYSRLTFTGGLLGEKTFFKRFGVKSENKFITVDSISIAKDKLDSCCVQSTTIETENKVKIYLVIDTVGH